MKRAFIIHGWRASSMSNWFPWLGMELQKLGYEVTIPDMPNTNEPQPEDWVATLAKLVGKPDTETVLVGHSLGAQAIMKYLEGNGKIGMSILVAPWPNPNAVKDSKYSKTASRWMAKDPDWDSIRKNSGAITAVFSTTDPFVVPEGAQTFKEKLAANIIIEKDGGHIVDGRLPSVLGCIA